MRTDAPGQQFSDEEAGKLEAYYIPSRYPGPIEREFNEKDAETALKIAEKLVTIGKSFKASS